MRWHKRVEWGPAALSAQQWAVLEAQIEAPDLDAAEQVLDDLTGFMDPFRADVEGRPMVGESDGQLAVVRQRVADRRGRRVLSVQFLAAGPVGQAVPHAFDRLGSASAELVDQLQAEGVRIEEIRWFEHPYVERPF